VEIFTLVYNLAATHMRLVNFVGITKPPSIGDEKLSPFEEEGQKRAEWFGTYGSAYYLMHATRPSTIGHIVATNPVALLAWYLFFYQFFSQRNKEVRRLISS
jgi:hypothetical protein